MRALTLRPKSCASRPATAGTSGREAPKMTTRAATMATQHRQRRRRRRCDGAIVPPASSSLNGDATSTSAGTRGSTSVIASLSDEEFERMRAYNLEMEV